MSGMRNLFVVAVLAGCLTLPGMAIAQPNEGGGRAHGAGAAGGNAGVLSGERGGGNGEGAAGGRGGGNGGANGAAASDRAAAERRAMMTNPALVSRVQQTLNILGFSAQPLTGTWNQDTALAMRYFQEAHGLPPTGQLNRASLEALGLAPSRAATANAGGNAGSGNSASNGNGNLPGGGEAGGEAGNGARGGARDDVGGGPGVGGSFSALGPSGAGAGAGVER